MQSVFRRLPETGNRWVDIHIDGKRVRALAGESVAAALLASGFRSCRSTPISGEPRAPFCMMGVCFECLVEINGIPNRQACQVNVEEGMQIRRQLGVGKGYH